MVDKITSPVGANEIIIKINNVIDAIPTSTTQLTNDSGFITGITSSMVTSALGYTPENQANKVTSISSSSTDTQYPSAKCVYDLVGNIESALNTINSGSNS